MPADKIVTLQCDFAGAKMRRTNPELFIREMTQRDLAAVGSHRSRRL